MRKPTTKEMSAIEVTSILDEIFDSPPRKEGPGEDRIWIRVASTVSMLLANYIRVVMARTDAINMRNKFVRDVFQISVGMLHARAMTAILGGYTEDRIEKILEIDIQEFSHDVVDAYDDWIEERKEWFADREEDRATLVAELLDDSSEVAMKNITRLKITQQQMDAGMELTSNWRRPDPFERGLKQ